MKQTTLTKTESNLLHAVITGSSIKSNKRVDIARDSLIEKGYLRVNEHSIIELNLCPDYYQQRGY